MVSLYSPSCLARLPISPSVRSTCNTPRRHVGYARRTACQTNRSASRTSITAFRRAWTLSYFPLPIPAKNVDHASLCHASCLDIPRQLRPRPWHGNEHYQYSHPDGPSTCSTRRRRGRCGGASAISFPSTPSQRRTTRLVAETSPSAFSAKTFTPPLFAAIRPESRF